MTYQWSQNAAYIQSLTLPWTPADGYSEAELSAAEDRLGVALPTILREFYRHWGRHRYWIDSNQDLLFPNDIFLMSGALLFMRENQVTGYWGLYLEALKDPDPMVHFGCTNFTVDNKLEKLDHWVQFYPLSTFLDAWVLWDSNGVHGAVSAERLDERQRLLVQQHWPAIRLNTAHWMFWPDAAPSWTLYGVDGLMLDFGPHGELWANVRDPSTLDAVRQVLGLTWERTW